MTRSKQSNNSGCGCASVPFSVILLLLGAGAWLWNQYEVSRLVSGPLRDISTMIAAEFEQTNYAPPPQPYPHHQPQNSAPIPHHQPQNSAPIPHPVVPTSTPDRAEPVPPPSEPDWELPPNLANKPIRGIYLSRYAITNNATEEMIRSRVRYYHRQGINTLIHGVFGNLCTMYPSEVMQRTFGMDACPNKFHDQWLDWMIDEAHKQGMEVHAYFEKGIKIDKNSPVYDVAVKRHWLVEGVDRTHTTVDHYVLDVANPEVARFFQAIMAEFVTRYPTVDAVQWDDYLAYHAELPNGGDRTADLTEFVIQLSTAMKAANPNVSFDLCHHNPYWSKRYFAADWQNWPVDRAFIQVYGERNFQDELNYVRAVDGIAITERQFEQLPALINDASVKNILLFPLSGEPMQTADRFKSIAQELN